MEAGLRFSLAFLRIPRFLSDLTAGKSTQKRFRFLRPILCNYGVIMLSIKGTSSFSRRKDTYPSGQIIIFHLDFPEIREGGSERSHQENIIF